jgi:uncharacterized protein YjdB
VIERASHRYRFLKSLLVSGAALCACGGNDRGLILEPVDSVTITAPTTEIRVGETVQLTATARDANGAVLDRSFIWFSGIGSVASVSQSGLVTGLKKGQSEIEAITGDVSGSIVITVHAPPPLQ